MQPKTYIRTTPEKLWRALIEPEFTRQCFFFNWSAVEIGGSLFVIIVVAEHGARP